MFIDVVGVLAIIFAGLVAVTLVFAQAAKPEGTPTPTNIEQPTAKPTKNPHGPHHHFDVRHPHKSTRPQLQNPQQKPD